MKIQFLAPLYKQNAGLTHKVILDFADIKLMTSGSAYSLLNKPATQGGIPQLATVFTTVALGAIPAGTLVKQFYGDVVTPFVGTGTLVNIVGDGGDTARYQASTTLLTAAPLQCTLKMPFRFLTLDTLDIIVTAGTDITTFTAGEVHFYVELFDPSGLTKVNMLRKD